MNIQKLMLTVLSMGCVSTGFADDASNNNDAAKCYLGSAALGLVHGIVNKKLMAPKQPNSWINASTEEYYSGSVFLGINYMLMADMPGYKDLGVKEKCLMLHGLAQAVGEMSDGAKPTLNFSLWWGCCGYAWRFLNSK